MCSNVIRDIEQDTH